MGLFTKKEKTEQEPQYYLSRINTQVMNYNVYEMNSKEKSLYSILLMVAGGVVGLIFYGGLFKSNGVATIATYISNLVVFALIGLMAIKSFLPVIRDMLRTKRIKKLRTQFCDFATSLTNALSSGMNMRDALQATYNDLQTQYTDGAYIVQEVGEILNGMNNNIAVEDMMADFGLRSGLQDIVNFGVVFETCYRTGGDIKSIVRRTTEILSEKIMIASEIETAITSNKMQMTVMNILPFIIIVMMRVMSPQFAESFASIIGVVALTIAAGMFIGAYKMGQKIMDIRG